MAWQFPVSTSGPGVAVPLSTTDSVFVADGVLVASTGSSAIVGTGSDHEVIIAGTAASSGSAAVFLGDNGTVDHDNSITVEAGGEIRSFGNYAINFLSFRNHLTNSGLIDGESGGIYLAGFNATTTSTIVNSGTIVAGGIGIARTSGSTETIAFTNSGTLSAQIAYGPFGAGTVARDVIANTGRISGTINLAGGNDVYSGASGRLTGHLLAGAGNDVAIGGIDNDWFEGGTENDALYGNAGKDRLLGEAGNDTLNGGLGNDILNGGANNDTLLGGVGNDYLTGSANYDFFVFNTALSASTNRDAITDFSHVYDTFRLENAVFTKLGAAGALNPAFFRAGAAAADANDYIVYNRATGLLSYDVNANAAGGAIAFAILTNKPVIAANDFAVI